MNPETQIQTIQHILAPLMTEDMFLVDIKVSPTNNFKIFLDADNGLSIDKCIKVNRALYRQLEESGLFPNGDFSLEVSSPGIDEPLKLHRQYVKNIGRNVELLIKDGTKITGKLVEVNEEGLTIGQMEGKGKKATVKNNRIPFTGIRQTTVLVSF